MAIATKINEYALRNKSGMLHFFGVFAPGGANGRPFNRTPYYLIRISEVCRGCPPTSAIVKLMGCTSVSYGHDATRDLSPPILRSTTV